MNQIPHTPHHLFLIGPPGAGKSTLGPLLATELGIDHIDCDQWLEQRAGCSVADIFQREGERGFRAHEQDAVRMLSARRQPTVISTGGGAVLNDDNRQLMRDRGWVIYLAATFDVLWKRLATAQQRPLIGSDPDRLKALLAAREDLYRETAHAVVYTDRLQKEYTAPTNRNTDEKPGQGDLQSLGCTADPVQLTAIISKFYRTATQCE